MRRIRRSTKKRIFLCGIGLLFWLGSIFCMFCFTGQVVSRMYEEEVRLLRGKLTVKEKTVYVAARNILAGERFTEENVVKKKIYASEEMNYFSDEEIFTKRALLGIPEGMQLLTVFGTEYADTGEVRECSFSEITLPDVLKTGDVVDVRIQYPNGENYCVLVGKTLYRSETDPLECRFLLTEQEQLYISSGLYDKAVYEGTKVYAVRYVTASVQESSKRTYVPAQAVALQLYDAGLDKERCLRLREELESRLSAW